MRIVEILTYVSSNYPDFSDSVDLTIIAIEDKYSINVDEFDKNKIDLNETKKIG